MPLHFQSKIVDPQQLKNWRESLRREGRRLVATNGCFDLLHVGHVTYLEQARNQGDCLVVGINGDQSVRTLKGEGRPINGQENRALVLAALESVNAVFIFQEVRAVDFLQQVQPDVYVKGGDYTLETLNQEERKAVEQGGGRIVIIPFVPGHSTTGLAEKIKRIG